jgi:hypothetical protein
LNLKHLFRQSNSAYVCSELRIRIRKIQDLLGRIRLIQTLVSKLALNFLVYINVRNVEEIHVIYSVASWTCFVERTADKKYPSTQLAKHLFKNQFRIRIQIRTSYKTGIRVQVRTKYVRIRNTALLQKLFNVMVVRMIYLMMQALTCHMIVWSFQEEKR